MVDDSSEVEDRETVMYTKNSRFKSFFKKKKMIHDEPLDSRDKIKDETIEYSCQKEEYKNWHDNLKDIQREKDELENKEVKDDFGELIGVNSKIEELEDKKTKKSKRKKDKKKSKKKKKKTTKKQKKNKIDVEGSKQSGSDRNSDSSTDISENSSDSRKTCYSESDIVSILSKLSL